MKIIFSFIYMSILLFSSSINEQIHALEKASPEERVALMNHIKEQLITMNHQEHMNTIATLQEKLHSNNEKSIVQISDSVQSIPQNQGSISKPSQLEHYEIQDQVFPIHTRESELHQYLKQDSLENHNGSEVNG